MPLLFALWRRRRRTRLLAYADPALLPWAATRPTAQAGGRLRAAAHALAWVLLALAAAGPRVPLAEADRQGSPRHLLTVMAVIDVSASMRATDVEPGRLARARLELLDWLPRLRGERVGIVVYAGEAGVLLPPTDDAALLARALDQVGPALIEAQGSHLAAALDLARAQLDAAPGRARAVLLVSDAGEESIDAAAQAAVDALRDARIPLFVLGVGSEAGAPIPLPEGGVVELDGQPVTARMAATTFRQWANATGGRFAAVRDGDADWVALHDQGIAALPGDPVPPQASRAWREHYAWFLLPALALLMALALPRRAIALLALALLGATGAPPPAWADEAAAWQAWQQRQYGRAQILYAAQGGYRGEMGAGGAAWKQGDYAAAVRHFGAALLLAASVPQRADALYNLGNALYGRGQWQAALDAWDAVLRLRPGDARAAANRELARQKLARQRPESPIETDLGGRRGFLAEGRIQADSQTGAPPEDPDFDDAGMQRDGGPQAAAGARAPGAASARQPIQVDARLAQSGQKKLPRVQDRSGPLLRELLKQDARRDDAARQRW
jgi:Ca-activated chloride channel family protein